MHQLDTMTRHEDHQTSIDAGFSLLPHLSDLQGKVLNELREAGTRGLTDGELERFAAGWGCKPNTVRGRRRDLYLHKKVVVKAIDPETGKPARRGGMTVWRALTDEELSQKNQQELFD